MRRNSSSCVTLRRYPSSSSVRYHLPFLVLRGFVGKRGFFVVFFLTSVVEVVVVEVFGLGPVMQYNCPPGVSSGKCWRSAAAVGVGNRNHAGAHRKGLAVAVCDGVLALSTANVVVVVVVSICPERDSCGGLRVRRSHSSSLNFFSTARRIRILVVGWCALARAIRSCAHSRATCCHIIVA